jgi:hypothetical protein
MSQFLPWVKYSPLTQDRLSAIANIIRHVRRETVALHDPIGGDNEWSLGCRIYARTCHCIRGAANDHQWLTILPEAENLSFSFAIGSIPFRFYRGKPNDPPGRYLIKTYGELHQLQTALEIEGLRPLDKILRLAVETDASREVSDVSFVETDEAGNVTETYRIPFDIEATNITPIQVKPVDLPPPTLEPLRDEEQEKQKKQKKANERNLVSK